MNVEIILSDFRRTVNGIFKIFILLSSFSELLFSCSTVCCFAVRVLEWDENNPMDWPST